MRRVALLLVFIVLTATSASPTASAAGWSTPVDVSSASTFIDDPFIGFGSSGVGLAAWHWQNNTSRAGIIAPSGERVATRAASGVFGPQRAAPNVFLPPVVYGRDHAVAVTESTSASRRGSRTRIGAAFARLGGAFGRPKMIDTIEQFGRPALAANDAGGVAVAYIQARRDGARVVKLALRSGGGLARPQVVVGRGRANAVTVAIGPRGDLVVAWERNGRIEARIRHPHRRLGPIVRVGRGVKLGSRLRAAVARDGRVWIAWSSQRLSEGGGNGPFALRSSVTSKRSSRFQTSRLLDRYDRRASDEATFDLALDAADNGFVAWSTFDGQNLRARLGYATRAGRFINFQTLSRVGYDAAVGDLATSRRSGEALVVWSRLDSAGELGTDVLSGYRLPSGDYRGEERVSRGNRARRPAVAFDPRTGAPTAVWSQREGPDGPGVPLSMVRTFLRASTRS